MLKTLKCLIISRSSSGCHTQKVKCRPISCFSTSVPESRNAPNEITRDGDIFGNYSQKTDSLDLIRDDPEDVIERKRRNSADRQHSSYYVKVIKSHLANNQYVKARDFLEERMLEIDKVRPDTFIYDLLISHCGRRGDVREAFRLYNQVKKRGYFVTGGQYTSLFNACSNSTRSHHALEVASKVRQYLSNDEQHEPNIKNFNAMMKAFGRHGDLKTCFAIMDEVLEKRGKVREDTYNFLLQACISDGNSGFRHALHVWHKMLTHKADPSIFTFNLMLRATRDCGLGAPEDIEAFIKLIVSEKNLRRVRKLTVVPAAKCLAPTTEPMSISDAVSLHEPADHTMSNSPESSIAKDSKTDKSSDILSKPNSETQYLTFEVTSDLPNLLAVQPNAGSALQCETFITAYHRLLLMGGVTGFIQVMDSLKIKPDVKTFTLLLDIVPSCQQTEEDLMKIANAKKIKTDTGFYNIMIKKRSYRYDYAGAKDVLRLMQQSGTHPDLTTFGTLALTCRNQEDASKLVETMRELGIRTNSPILTPLVRQATYQGDLSFIQWILQVMKEDSVQPDTKLMIMLNDFMTVKSKQFT